MDRDRLRRLVARATAERSRPAPGRPRVARRRGGERGDAVAFAEDRPAPVLRVVCARRSRGREPCGAPRAARDGDPVDARHGLCRDRLRARLSRRRRAVGRARRDLAEDTRRRRSSAAAGPSLALDTRGRQAATGVSGAGRQGVRYTARTMSEIPMELLKRLPKTDLHCHLDGSLRLERVAYELAVDALAEYVRYMEVRFSPLLHVRVGLRPSQVVEAVLRGLR